MATEDDSVTSCSIEETNEIRKKLGLKPLITASSDPKPEPENDGQDTEEVLERLNRIKQRRARETLIKGGGIADSIKKGEVITTKRKKYVNDSSDVDPLDLESWSKKMRNVTKSTIVQAENAITYSDDEDDDLDMDENRNENFNKNKNKNKENELGDKYETKDEVDGSKIKVLHKMNELDLVKGDEVTLTLKDVGVLEAEAAGISDLDFLENAELVDMKKDRKKMEQRLRNQYGNYIPYDDQEDPLNPGFLKHYDDTIKETQGLKLTSLANEDDGFFIKVNQNNGLEDDDLDMDENKNKNFNSMFIKKNKTNNPKTELIDETDVFASLKAKREKLKKRPKSMNWNKVFSKEEEDINLNLDNLVPIKIRKETVSLNDDEDEKLYSKISSHRRRLNNYDIKKEEIKEETKGHVDFDVTKPGQSFEMTATTEFCKVVKTPMEKLSEQESEPKYKIKVEEPEIKDEDPNTLSEMPLGDGISAALSFIKQRGDFIEKKAHTRSKEVQLNYLDSYGNEMTPKEAFRQISWVFHGKKPSMNKLEKKAKRMEKERIARLNPVEGLPTMKALFTHQAKEETAHLVLTGNTNNN